MSIVATVVELRSWLLFLDTLSAVTFLGLFRGNVFGGPKGRCLHEVSVLVQDGLGMEVVCPFLSCQKCDRSWGPLEQGERPGKPHAGVS